MQPLHPFHGGYMQRSGFVLLLSCLAVPAFCQAKNESKAGQANAADVKSITIYTTSDSLKQRLTQTGTVDFAKAEQPLENETSVFVNPGKTFQTFIGIGGAITDASAETFATLSKEKQQELLDAYYDAAKGIGYTLARVNIHSCDFSSESYTYIAEGDKELTTFSIDHDKKYRIPLVRQAIRTAGGKLTIYGSPWSPPAFMKSNSDMLHGGKLLPEYYQAWATYFTKFVKAWELEGVPIWGISIQNEPMAVQTWESCIYTAEEERDFLKNYLGPTMKKQGLESKKIIVWDHNRDLMNHRANVIFDDPIASKYAWGMGFHWYEDWSGGEQMYNNVAKVHEAYPAKNLLFTEGCNDKFNPEKYQQWSHGEKYGRSMINDFNNGTSGWTDWNILLDEKGGPNHVGNFCFAPIHADTKTDQLIYTPTYYYIGHFSKFIRPNAKRVSTVCSRSQLLTTSFRNDDGTMVTVVMNHTDKNIAYTIYQGPAKAKVEIGAHSIQTLIYR
jgi:O-glycosyl hydrolase